MTTFNKFGSLPFIPYKIVLKLLENQNLAKLLYYNTYDALSQPDLTYEQKVGMIWNNNDQSQDYHILLTNVQPNEMTVSSTLMKCYRYRTDPLNPILSTVSYQFDCMFGTKTAMVEYQGIPCNRGDVFEMELMQSLNGQDVAGIGFLQYNSMLSRYCGSQVGIGNNNTFTGFSTVLATQISDTTVDDCNG